MQPVSLLSHSFNFYPSLPDPFVLTIHSPCDAFPFDKSFSVFDVGFELELINSIECIEVEYNHAAESALKT